MEINKIINGDSLSVLKTLPDESIDCIVTSPPYYALRDYKVEGQIGTEKTIDEYIHRLVGIFSECNRVLKKTGTCWVVIGDTYASGGGLANEQSFIRNGRMNRTSNPNPDYPSKAKLRSKMGKSLLLIPERFAIKMIDSGWILRNKIIWKKRNCMPSSAKDRFTVDYEYIYFFTKSKKYYFKTQYEPYSPITVKEFEKEYNGKGIKDYEDNGVQNPSDVKRRIIKSGIKFGGVKRKGYGNPVYSGKEWEFDLEGKGRIKRCIWTINTKPFKGAHFAVFPEELVERCMDAGCPEEICKKCKKPRSTIFKSVLGYGVKDSNTKADYETTHNMKCLAERRQYYRSLGYESTPYKKIGLSDCGCNAGFESGIILDPFIGSGTVGVVALKRERKFLGIELNKEYIDIANKRIAPRLYQTTLSNTMSTPSS